MQKTKMCLPMQSYCIHLYFVIILFRDHYTVSLKCDHKILRKYFISVNLVPSVSILALWQEKTVLMLCQNILICCPVSQGVLLFSLTRKRKTSKEIFSPAFFLPNSKTWQLESNQRANTSSKAENLFHIFVNMLPVKF